MKIRICQNCGNKLPKGARANMIYCPAKKGKKASSCKFEAYIKNQARKLKVVDTKK